MKAPALAALMVACASARLLSDAAPEPEPQLTSPTPPTPPLPPRPPSAPLAVGTGCASLLGLARTIETIEVPLNALQEPRAIAFNPAGKRELWVADRGRSALARLQLGEGTSLRHFLLTKDRAEYHYMASVSSLGFDATGQFATCQESVNQYNGEMEPNFFMGPTLWDSGARGWTSSKQEPCAEGETCFMIHTDMLHETPLCMGITHDPTPVWTSSAGTSYRNVYWAFGGGHSQLVRDPFVYGLPAEHGCAPCQTPEPSPGPPQVRYDFESDHGPGSMDHSLASVRRYSGLKLSRVEGVPSHMVIDAAQRVLYIADSGADRVVAVNLESGDYARDAKTPSPGCVRISPAISVGGTARPRI